MVDNHYNVIIMSRTILSINAKLIMMHSAHFDSEERVFCRKVPNDARSGPIIVEREIAT